MNNLGEPLTEAEVKSMIAEADLDGDGKINFQEFSRLMANSGSVGGPSQSKGVWPANTGENSNGSNKAAIRWVAAHHRPTTITFAIASEK